METFLTPLSILITARTRLIFTGFLRLWVSCLLITITKAIIHRSLERLHILGCVSHLFHQRGSHKTSLGNTSFLQILNIIFVQCIIALVLFFGVLPLNYSLFFLDQSQDRVHSTSTSDHSFHVFFNYFYSCSPHF